MIDLRQAQPSNLILRALRVPKTAAAPGTRRAPSYGASPGFGFIGLLVATNRAGVWFLNAE
jgi:hypothetical protein